MPRNLDRRIEVLTPIDGARVRQELNAVLDSVFADTTAWELGSEGSWSPRDPGKAKPHAHQTAMQRRALVRARRRDGRARGR
jgi:polyphosphate kinase